MDKLVSVIIPTYSRAVNIKRAINSVLSQTYFNIEIIVVDDNGEGSIEQKETEERIRDYLSMDKFFYIKHKLNKNGAAARNTGIRYSHGEYIAFLDDDDEFLPTKIDVQLKALERLDNSWGGCYCNINLIGRKKQVLLNDKSGNLVEDLLLGTVRFNSSTLLLRRNVCLELNGFDESFVRHQDWEFMIRFFRKYKIFLPTMDYLINKYISRGEYSNVPDAISFIRIKDKFLSTFEVDIKECTSSNAIFHKHWMEVVLLLLRDHRFCLFVTYLLKADSYKKCSFKDCKNMFYSFLSSFGNKF